MSLKTLFLGQARSLADERIFHKVSLIAVFAWVGLGADGLSSSCYGPEETFKALGSHASLSLFVALASVLTISVLCASYSQIISLFPSGGGGYLVASKLLSPAAGVVSGSALLIDYVLTITISVAGAADATFSLLPLHWHAWKLPAAATGIGLLTLINLRGVRESVMLFAPIFFVFLGTHAFALVFAVATKGDQAAAVIAATFRETGQLSAEIGLVGLLAVLLKAFSLGAGTYTGIEAVSNGLPILREPRVRTGRRTMLYMGISLALTAAGLLVAYLLHDVGPQEGMTLNAVLFTKLTAGWSLAWAKGFQIVILGAEAALLFIAAQAGFLDGPRVLASMAVDRWLPSRFAHLSDRLVTQNGILLMGAAALVVLLATGGSVALLVVLYSINVFITFTLSQLGMVRHWWQVRASEPAWRSRLAVNGLGLALSGFILVALATLKFHEGGWITLLITGLLVAAAFSIRKHYDGVRRKLDRLESLLKPGEARPPEQAAAAPSINAEARTAIVLVNGYNGLGLHTLLNVPRLFGDTFRNYVFVTVGVVDAGNFKGADEIAALRTSAQQGVDRYVAFANARGYGSEAVSAIGTDLIGEIERIAVGLKQRFAHSVVFGGQLLFEPEGRFTRWLHNHTVFAVQRRLYVAGIPLVILPIRVG